MRLVVGTIQGSRGRFNRRSLLVCSKYSCGQHAIAVGCVQYTQGVHVVTSSSLELQELSMYLDYMCRSKLRLDSEERY